MARDPFAAIRQFYEEGGYIPKRKETAAEKKRRIKMALYGSSQMDFSEGMAGGGRVHADTGGWLSKLIQSLGKAQGSRLARAADLTNLERFNEPALREAIKKPFMGVMPPGDFEKYAHPLDVEGHTISSTENPGMTFNRKYLAEGSPPGTDTYDDYMRYLQGIGNQTGPQGGFSSVPALNIGTTTRNRYPGIVPPLPPDRWQIVGHNGRHRMRALDEMMGDPQALTTFYPQVGADYGAFPNLSKVLTYPENPSRLGDDPPRVRLPEMWAHGGRIGFADGSRVGRLLRSIGNDFGTDWGQRAVQAADLTDLSRFSEKALSRVFGPSGSGRLMVMKPSQFENFATPLGRDMGGNYMTFNSPRDFRGTREDYLKYLQNIAKTSGFNEVPRLGFDWDRRLLQSGEAVPQTVEHEGRHRLRALAAMGDDPTLVQLNPRSTDYRLGKLSSDERQAKYEDLFGESRNILPQIYQNKNIEDWTDVAPTIGKLPEFWAGGGRVGFAKGDLVRMLSRFRDPVSNLIGDWKWRPLADVAKDIGGGSVSPAVENYGRFMKTMSDKASREGLSVEDLAKAHQIATFSMNRSAINASKLRERWPDAPERIQGMIRPEGAMAEWLRTPMGGQYLQSMATGKPDAEAIAQATNYLGGFGKQNEIAKVAERGASFLPGQEGRASELVARAAEGKSSPDEWHDFLDPLYGIQPPKHGFYGALVGRGDMPTFDARQIIGQTGMPTADARRFTRYNEPARDAVARLSARQEALGLDLPSDLDPYRQHLWHHELWDRFGGQGEQTTHQDIIDSMLGKARGGRIAFQEGGAGVLAAPLKLVNLLQRAAAMRGEAPGVTAKLLEKTKEGVKGALKTQAGLSTRTGTAPFEDVTAKIAPSPFTPPPRTLTPESIPPYSWMVGGMSDLTGAGPTVHAINGTRLYRPVELSGGSDFPYWQQHYGNLNQLWAAAKAPLSGMYNALRSAGAKGDDPAFFVNKLMGPTSGDQSNMAMSAIEQMLRRGPQSAEEADKLTAMIRNYKTSIPDPVRSKELGKMTTMYASPMPDFPHVRSDDLHDYLMNLPMGQRSALMKVLDKKGAQDLGAPNPAAVRFAINDPALFGVERGSVGRTVGGFELGAPLIDDPAMPHPSYPTHMPGTVQGGLDRPVPGQLFFPDAWKQLTKEYKDPGVLMSNFMNKPVVQQATPEWLDTIMPSYEKIAKGWSPSGLKRGGRAGEAHVSMPHMPTTMPQYGPMHYGSSGMARGGRTAFGAGGVVGARRPTRNQLRYHSSMWQEDWG